MMIVIYLRLAGGSGFPIWVRDKGLIGVPDEQQNNCVEDMCTLETISVWSLLYVRVYVHPSIMLMYVI
jgi:hypothetical protein